MSKKFFTTESLATLVNEIKNYVANAILTKADSSHSHTITDVDSLQDTLNAKATQNSLDSHVSDTSKHITEEERTNWNAAKTHADSAHVTSVNGMSGDVVIEVPKVEVDSTLSIEGQAADAKSVGDAIKAMNHIVATDDGNGIITLSLSPLAPADKEVF